MFAMRFHLTRVEGSVRVVQPTQHGIDSSVGEIPWVATGWLALKVIAAKFSSRTSNGSINDVAIRSITL